MSQAATTAVTQFPWELESRIRANLALGNLAANLQKWLTQDGRIHAETLLATAGVLAGFAAQNAALARAAELGQNRAPVPRDSIVLVTTADGGRFLFGDWINLHLFPNGQDPYALWGLLAGAAVSAGHKLDELPVVNEVAGHFAAALGKPSFGAIRVPAGHTPHLPPVELLRRLWVPTRGIFTLPLPQTPNLDEAPLKEAWWPILLSLVTSGFQQRVKEVLAAPIAMRLAFEAAVIGAKIDPETIDPGRWKLTPEGGELLVSRLKS